MFDQDCIAADSLQPFDHVLGVGHAAAKEQQLGPFRSKSNGQLVMNASDGIAEHLKFIDHQKTWTFAAKKSATLRFEGSNYDPRIEVHGNIAGGNAHIPATGSPFRQFI